MSLDGAEVSLGSQESSSFVGPGPMGQNGRGLGLEKQFPEPTAEVDPLFTQM